MNVLENGNVEFTLEEVNNMSILADEAANQYKSIGCESLEKSARELFGTLHNICREHGLYDE